MCEQLVLEQVARATLLNCFSQDALSSHPHHPSETSWQITAAPSNTEVTQAKK